jgi:hypothetical protein
MPRAFVALGSRSAGTLVLCFALAASSSAQSVWSGLSFSFTRPDGVDPSLPENQDGITDAVRITRDSTGGIYNFQTEVFYSGLSPADTEWATDLNNPAEMIAATNWANLNFTNWIDAYGSAGSGSLPSRLIGRDAVVRLISDDIYLDLRFTGWTQQGGGGFSYMRAVNPVPEPGAFVLALVGVLALWCPRLGRRQNR